MHRIDNEGIYYIIVYITMQVQKHKHTLVDMHLPRTENHDSK